MVSPHDPTKIPRNLNDHGGFWWFKRIRTPDPLKQSSGSLPRTPLSTEFGGFSVKDLRNGELRNQLLVISRVHGDPLGSSLYRPWRGRTVE